ALRDPERRVPRPEHADRLPRAESPLNAPVRNTAIADAKRSTSRLLGQVLLHPPRVLDRVAAPVVVEIHKNIDARAPGGDSPTPALKLGLGVAPVAPASPVVEAQERPRSGQLAGLERPLRVVADHERDVALAERVIDRLREPALVPELEAV